MSALVPFGVVVSFASALLAQVPVDLLLVDSPGNRSGAAFAFDPATGRSVLHGGEMSQRHMAFGTYLWDGSGWSFDGTNCVNSGTPPSRIGQHLLVDSRRRRLLLVGGYDGGWPPTNETSIWQYRGGCWTLLSWQTAVVLPAQETTYAYDERRDRIVAYRATPLNLPTASETWEWDGVAWTLLAPATSPPPRSFASTTYDRARQRTVLYGGWTSLPDTWEWDGTNWYQVPTPSSPAPGYGSVLMYDSVGSRCLAIAGSPLDLWSYDGATWLRLTNGGIPYRTGSAFAFDSLRQELLIFGGPENNALSTSALYGWNGSSWRIRANSNTPNPGRGLTHELRGTAMVVAPSVAFAPTTMELWERRAAGWSCLATNGNVPSRAQAGVAYDRLRNRIVLFGGIGGNGHLAETWEWDSAGWLQASPGTSPPAREGHGMAWDAARGEVLLFGGRGPSSYFNDTWTWDGTNWTLLASSVSPSPRANAPMACDAARQVVVLYGGFAGSVTAPHQSLYDTWEWDGSTWQTRVVVGPLGTSGGSSMGFDARRNVTVLCNYLPTQVIGNLYLYQSQFWDWDGSSWTFRERGGTFPYGGALDRGFAFDPQVQRCVLHEETLGTCYEFGAVQALPTATWLGFGCVTWPQPLLRFDPTYLDSVIRVELWTGSTSLVPTFLLAGQSNTQWNGTALPFDLTPLGATGCSLRVAPDVTTVLGYAYGGYGYWWHIPNAPQLVGLRVSLQGAVMAIGVNPADLLLSDGVEVTFGLR